MSISTAKADLWNSTSARNIARDIASISGLYCGPAVVGWVAAVWNRRMGRTYDYMRRLRDKKLFPDGPRDFTGKGSLPKFQSSLRAILKRETDDELSLGESTHRKYGTIHVKLKGSDYPIVIRMQAPEFWDGLHYVTLYKSEKRIKSMAVDRIKFYWQDNGFYGNSNGGNSGLYGTAWRDVGHNVFFWGAKQVVPTLKGLMALAQNK